MSVDDELEKVRCLLNTMIISSEDISESMLRISQELDVLVVKSIKEKNGTIDSLLMEDEINE